MDTPQDSTQDSSSSTETPSPNSKPDINSWLSEREAEAKELTEATMRLGRLIMEAERCQVGHGLIVRINTRRKERRRALLLTSERAMSNIPYLRTINNWTVNKVEVLPARKRARGSGNRVQVFYKPFFDHQTGIDAESPQKTNETVTAGEAGN